MEVNVESGDVIRLVEQFLKENGLTNTLMTLQEESGVSLNTVDSVESFLSSVQKGHWENVLTATSTLRLPDNKLIRLYEQIVIELAEARDVEIARALLRQTAPLQVLRQSQPDRYLRLEHLLQRQHFDPHEAYPEGSTKETRRLAIASDLASEVSEVPASRLLALLSQALKWQQYQGLLPPGATFDLFQGSAPVRPREDETHPTQLTHTIKFGKKSHAECAAFSMNGYYLVSGSVDGFVEVWDFDTGKLNRALKYQAEDKIMMHEESVLAVCFSGDSELIASGAKDGKIKVWRVKTGQCVRRFERAHTLGVTSICFSKDGSQVLSGSFDQTAKLHGLKSRKTLKEFRGHTSFVTMATFSVDGTLVLTASSDGTIRVWDAKTSDCRRFFRPPQQNMSIEIPIHWIQPYPKSENMLVVNRSPSAKIMSPTGEVIKTFLHDECDKDFQSGVVSHRGEWTYLATEDGHLHCFQTDTGNLVHSMKIHEREVLGIACHPYRNVMATWSDDGTLKLWKP